ncbi:hypothetical protein [Rosettibacter firmus]|uniref:hypothetical protein n=1 Tax=Rosettibacter firmus TaxID=3111522 RepID=UPI00336C00E7
MAKLNKQFFGFIQGTFGKAVFKQRNGKNFITQKPESYTPPNSEDYKKRIYKFSCSAKISSLINSNLELKEIWTSHKPNNLSTFNYLMSTFCNYTDNNSVINELIIVPDSNIGVRLDSVTIANDKLNIKLLPLTETSLINPDVEKFGKIISLLLLTNSTTETIPQFDVSLMSSNSVIINLDNPLNFETLIPTTIQQKLSNYQDKKLFSTLLTYDENNSLINYSSTFYSQLS